MEKENEIDPVEIKSGPVKVIFSSSITAFKGNPIEIIFGPSEFRFRIIFIFKSDEGIQRMESKLPDPNSLEISLFNFNSSLGSFSNKPLSIGTLNDKELFMHFRIYGSEKNKPSDPMMHITLYQGLEIRTSPLEDNNGKK